MTAEWRNVTDRFQTFIGNLQPSALERRRVAMAATEIADCLGRRFKSDAGRSRSTGHKDWPVDDFLMVGGYAKGTAIRPVRVADMLYVLPPEPRNSAETRAGGLLDDMAAALSHQFATHESPEGGWLWVRSLDDVAIRLAPCFQTRGDNLIVALPGTHGGWLATDPVSEAARLYEADLASGGKATHLLMMLKSWRRHNKVTIESFALELLVCEFTRTWIFPRRSLLFYDWMVRDFFFWIAHQAGRDILTPGALEPIRLGNSWVAAAERAFARAQTACLRERKNADLEALDEWQAIFGPLFSGESQVIPATAVARLSGATATQPGLAAPER